MRATGIVAEYNPFHDGHRYLIEKSRHALGADVCVSVMSGPFSQRGTPCLYDKWTRAEQALSGGVDLVVELPVVYATGSAELFARGAVSILEGFGGIDHIAFGSECGDVTALKNTAEFLREHQAEINRVAGDLQRKGESYPRARESACVSIAPGFDISLIREPNNILALEYLKWTKEMEPYTVSRSDSGYHETGTALRRVCVEHAPERYRQMDRSYFDLIRYAVLRMDGHGLEHIAGAEGGLGNKFRKEMAVASDTEDLIDRIKTKGYTRTRVTRLLTHVLLGITEELSREAVPYIRILGFSQRGAAFLKHCTRTESTRVPVLTGTRKDMECYPELVPMLEKDILANQIYNILTGENLYRNHDFVRKPVITRF